jgi:hypothetical protein
MRVRVSSSACRHFLSIAFSLLTLAALSLFSSAALAQESANAASSPTPQPLITQAIDETQLTTLWLPHVVLLNLWGTKPAVSKGSASKGWGF